MKDSEKTKEQLIKELQQLRKKLVQYEHKEREQKTTEDTLKKTQEDLLKGVETRNEELSRSQAILKREINERRLTEQALQLSEEKYRKLTENINVGIYRNTVGPKGKFIEANSAIVKMFGYQNKEEFLSINVADLYQNPEDRKRFNEKILKDGFVKNEILQLKKKDGTPFYGSVSAVAVKDEAGKVKFYDGIVEDIDDRIQMEEELRQSETRYRKLFEDSPIGLYRTSPDGKIIEVNPTLVEMLGFPDRKSLLAANVPDIYVDAEDRNKWLEKIKQGGIVLDYEVRWYRTDKSIIWVRESCRAVKDDAGKIIYYEGSVEDITPQKRAEMALQAEKIYLENLFDSAQEAIVMCENDGHVLKVNKEFLELFGYQEDEVVGRLVDELVAPKNLRGDATDITSKVAQGEQKALETIRQRKNGELIYVSVLASPIIIDGEQVGVYGIYRDITERKRMEEELRALSLIDDLTNLYNRRGFLTLARQQLKLANRTNRGAVVLFVDLDNMKWINDNLGHPTGDKALKDLSKVLRNTFRKSDIIGRVGGDEFIVFAIEAVNGSTDVLSNRLINNIKRYNEQEDIPYKLSLSIGFANYNPKSPCKIEELIHRADARMYEEKKKKHDKSR